MTAMKLYEDLVSGPAVSPKAAPDVDHEIERRLARARGKARAEGFAEGVANAEARFERDLLTQITATSEALSRFSADRQAADATSVDTIRRILAHTISAFTPSMADGALPTLVAEKVAAALSAELDGRIKIEVASEQFASVQAALACRDNRVDLIEDALIPLGSARVSWQGGFDHIDAGAAIRAGAALLDERIRAHTARQPEITLQQDRGARTAPPPDPETSTDTLARTTATPASGQSPQPLAVCPSGSPDTPTAKDNNT